MWNLLINDVNNWFFIQASDRTAAHIKYTELYGAQHQHKYHISFSRDCQSLEEALRESKLSIFKDMARVKRGQNLRFFWLSSEDSLGGFCIKCGKFYLGQYERFFCWDCEVHQNEI